MRACSRALPRAEFTARISLTGLRLRAEHHLLDISDRPAPRRYRALIFTTQISLIFFMQPSSG